MQVIQILETGHFKKYLEILANISLGNFTCLI